MMTRAQEDLYILMDLRIAGSGGASGVAWRKTAGLKEFNHNHTWTAYVIMS